MASCVPNVVLQVVRICDRSAPIGEEIRNTMVISFVPTLACKPLFVFVSPLNRWISHSVKEVIKLSPPRVYIRANVKKGLHLFYKS